ncbi:MAG: YihA family ribosome biogenesis GTP-binding protein [Candidatus Cloacimonetes bacterium]|nr:YihA family ribosome biogenesis GTP-binding protein [Candidatus Cloacimonadota bacterium]
MMRIVESKFIKSVVKPTDYPASPYADIAFVGKSNVGKSSLINTILNRKAIAKVSRIPGKTRLINFFEIRFKTEEKEDGFVNFVDLPGYGYAKVSKTERVSWDKMIQNYFKKRLNLKGVILLVDIRHSADPKDIVMLKMLRDEGIPFAVVATKSDKIAKSKLPVYLEKLSAGLEVNNKSIYSFSSLKKTGIEDILNWINNQIL